MKTTNTLRTLTTLALLIAGNLLVAGTAQADTTTDRIKQTGLARIGFRTGGFPLSYAQDGQPRGLVVDLCARVVQTINPNARIEWVAVDTKTRFALLTDNKIDLECGTTTSTSARRKDYAASAPVFIASVVAAVHKSNPAVEINDLGSNTQLIFTTGATAKEVAMSSSYVIAKRVMFAKNSIVETPSHPESFDYLAKHPNSVFVLDDILLQSLIANSKAPGEFKILKDRLSVEPYSIFMRKTDKDLKNAVNRSLLNDFKSGAYDTLYTKWFQSPVAPTGVNLNLEQSPTLKDQVRHPYTEAAN